MARPKTQSKPVSFRLTEAAYVEALRRATAKGMTVGEWFKDAAETQLQTSASVRRGVEQAERGEVTPRPKGKAK